MAEISRFSLCYDGDEDRIAWDMIDADGATMRLWLTQKLCRGLVGALGAMLEKRTAAGSAPERRAALNAFEQAAAMARFGKVAGVTPGADAPGGLVRAVHIDPSDRGLGFRFDFGEGETRTLGVDIAAVRQTLAVMRRLHAAAAWPADFWPAWIADPATAADAGALN
ncbi:MAG TPA: hypothetical protein VMU93_15475 [Caulobacteraceae bacterium]|nr:hypothetical protein [Caulobacteraceae bacterium]